MKYTAERVNKLTIYNNCLVNGNTTTLFYMVNLYNHLVYTEESISRNIDSLYNLILNIENIFGSGGLEFSMFRLKDVLSPNEYLDSLTKTIRLWDPDFQLSDSFVENIQYTVQYYCILAVNIDSKKAIDFNKSSIKDMVKDYFNLIADSIANNRQQLIDKAAIDETSSRIANVGQSMIRPCPEEILLSFYLKRVFPSYDIIIPKDQQDSTKAVLAYLEQDLTPHFNYFEMSNAGVELFGAHAHTTYGSVIDIIEFPEEIISESFSLNYDWLVCNCKTLSKQKAKVRFARRKKDIEYEEETAAVAGSTGYNLELQDYKDIADTAMAAVSVGKKMIDADIHILVTAKSLEELEKKRYDIISNLKNLNIIATFAPDQAKEYVESFVRMRPSGFPFIMDLRYPLSFRLNQGSAAGDFSSKFTSPVLGQTTSRSEATD